MVKKMNNKKMEVKPKEEEGKLKTYAQNIIDLGTASTDLATVLAEQTHTNAKTAKTLKDAYRNIKRMYGQKQGT
jgi:hypothetical protein